MLGGGGNRGAAQSSCRKARGVFTEADREAFDQYGRELLYLFKDDGTFVNRALVLAGAAEAIRVGQNDHYWPQLQEAQRDAETAGAGMWSAC